MKVGTLDAYYCGDKETVAQYYRVDYDITMSLGELFKEPHPHLHLYPKREPRIPFIIQNSQTILADFITFLYLNYSYDAWQLWVRKVWKNHTDYPDHKDPFHVICDAFKASQHETLLSTYKDPLHKLKNLIREEINKRSQPFKPATENWDLLSLY